MNTLYILYIELKIFTQKFLKMAAGVGFEPTDAINVNDFQDRHNKPLCHPAKTHNLKEHGGERKI